MKNTVLLLASGLLVFFLVSVVQAEEYKLGQRLDPNSIPKNIADPNYPEINWPALTPASWDSIEMFSKFNFAQFSDNDPKANEELKKMRAVFDKAPVKDDMNGKKISIAGFMVPLDEKNGAVSEFLLVPFYGACIHVPPPPANQIIHATANEPIKNIQPMAAITIKGTINTTYTESNIGNAGYSMQNAEVIPHVSKTCMFSPICE